MVANAELYKALSKAQGEVENAIKGSKNPFIGNKYADLNAVLEVSKPVLAANGLSIVTLPGVSTDRFMGFTTTLSHVSGESVTREFSLPFPYLNRKEKEKEGLPLDAEHLKRDAQAGGSMLSYGRRYCNLAWLNMGAEDDDGETAVGRGGSAKPVAKPAAPARPVKELIEALSNAPSLAALDALRPDCGPYRNTEHWPSIEAVAVATKARLEQEAKDAAKKR